MRCGSHFGQWAVGPVFISHKIHVVIQIESIVLLGELIKWVSKHTSITSLLPGDNPDGKVNGANMASIWGRQDLCYQELCYQGSHTSDKTYHFGFISHLGSKINIQGTPRLHKSIFKYQALWVDCLQSRFADNVTWMATAIIDTLHFRWQLIAPGGEDYAYACWIFISVASDIILFKWIWGGEGFGKTLTYSNWNLSNIAAHNST